MPCPCCGSQPCCFTSTNCDIVVTVTYSNGQSRTNGDDQLDENGNPISDTPISVSIGDCNTVGFVHQILSLGSCNQGASKQQKLNCTTCCTDPAGVGCGCTFGTIVSENYGFSPNDPGAECDPAPSSNYVTSVTFSLANCSDCPCEFP